MAKGVAARWRAWNDRTNSHRPRWWAFINSIAEAIR